MNSKLSYLLIVVIAGLLLFLEENLLWKAQEMNLFLNSWFFFKDQMVVPGGFLTWLGTFFTQFFYYPWLGVTLLAAWWMLLAWLVGRTFRLNGWWHLLAVIPVLFILVTIVDMGYWVYILKLRGHFFITTFGATAVTALLWAFRSLNGKCQSAGATRSPFPISSFSFLIAHCLFLICTAAIGYLLLGIYGLAATLLMSIWIWRLEPRWGRALTVSAVGVLSIIIVPLICYRHVFYEVNQDNIYFAALPLYFIQEEHHAYYVPFYLLLLFFVAMSIIPALSPKEKRVNRPVGKIKGQKVANPRHLWEPLGAMALLLAAAGYTAYFWNRDENFHHELVMERCIERLDWEGVVREAATQEDEPTRSIVTMRNIALARLGRQANEMYTYPNGSKRYDAPFDMRMMLVNGPLVYYHYGMANNCYRLSMEMGVEYTWRVDHLKYLARCSVLNGERQLALKYIGLLKQTAFFGEWADQLAQLIGKPDDIARSPEMGFITHMMHYKSEISSDQGYVEEFVMKRLAASTFTDDAIFQEQALLASMFTRDVKMFWRHLTNYVKLHPKQRLPRHIQEAAILLGTLEERPDLDTWPIDSSIRESCRIFCEVMPRYDNMEVGPVRKAVAPQFGRTYYYDYVLMNNLPQY